MDVIVINEGTTAGDIIEFPKLKSLKLSYLKKLKSFCSKKEDMHLSSTSITDNSDIPYAQSQPLFDKMVCLLYYFIHLLLITVINPIKTITLYFE